MSITLITPNNKREVIHTPQERIKIGGGGEGISSHPFTRRSRRVKTAYVTICKREDIQQCYPGGEGAGFVLNSVLKGKRIIQLVCGKIWLKRVELFIYFISSLLSYLLFTQLLSSYLFFIYFFFFILFSGIKRYTFIRRRGLFQTILLLIDKHEYVS